MKKETLTLAAVGDIHCKKDSQGTIQPIFAGLKDTADVLLLCGDLCDLGLPEEASILVREITSVVKIPILAVLGNHDVESGAQAEVTKILTGSGITVLDGDAIELFGVGFAGVKGFCGGFGRRMLEPWGEEIIKRYVREAVDESLKLESALARLRTPQRVALLHYSPIEATVEGEPKEIYPFLGSSRLEDPLNRYDVAVAFHGHVHRGALEGRTRAGVPVYNVAMPLLRRSFPDQPPLRFITIPTEPDSSRASALPPKPFTNAESTKSAVA
jgi:Icc-related predicted phosphoesterase